MIGKVISGGSFGGTVGYVMKEQSRVLEARGVEPPGVREMVEDFEDQARLNPRLQQNVGHISLSFSPEDAPKLTDERMTQIAVNLHNANVVCSNLDQTSSFDIFIKRLRGEPNNLPGFQTFD